MPVNANTNPIANPVANSALRISPIRAFNDNYIWCLQNGSTAVVVDPGDHKPVLAFLKEHRLNLSAILITHHHYDHTGGILALLEHYPEINVYGPHNPNIQGITHALREGDEIELKALALSDSVLETPGHTLDHIVYYDDTRLFCGDTLFSAGCGRMFEGTPEVFYRSLQKLASLPSHTQVYCTHEYTQANIKFALSVEPNNSELNEHAQWVQTQRQHDRITLPSTIQKESEINPFLRCHKPQLQQTVLNSAQSQTGNDANETTVFARLRSMKDSF